MTYQHRDYHLALDKLQTAPLTLTERDFDVLKSFNPADEVRGRDAVRQAQLAILTKAEGPLQTKAAPALRPSLNPKVLRAINGAFDTTSKAVVALDERVKVLDEQSQALTTRIQELEALTKTQAAALVDLRDENVALGKLVVNTQRPKISVDPSHGVKH